jgi:hypothetical protein
MDSTAQMFVDAMSARRHLGRVFRERLTCPVDSARFARISEEMQLDDQSIRTKFFVGVSEQLNDDNGAPTLIFVDGKGCATLNRAGHWVVGY